MKSKIQTLLIAGSLVCVASFASAADAGENWAKNCAMCRAMDGSGNTVMGKKSNVKDYTTAAGQAFSDDAAAKAIKDGMGKMKAFGDKLNDADKIGRAHV